MRLPWRDAVHSVGIRALTIKWYVYTVNRLAGSPGWSIGVAGKRVFSRAFAVASVYPPNVDDVSWRDGFIVGAGLCLRRLASTRVTWWLP
jgi:hypothetical protein